MLNIGGGEFLIILLVALVVLGPSKLPDAARQVGKVFGEFRRISAGFQREIQTAMNDPVSKVTGEPTPTSIKDVTTVAEPPPFAHTQFSSAAPRPEDSTKKIESADEANEGDAVDGSGAEHGNSNAADVGDDAPDAADVTSSDDTPDPPIMYGDR